MQRIGLDNFNIKCWFNSCMQLLSSIPEINTFFDNYTKNDQLIQKLKLFNSIIRRKLHVNMTNEDLDKLKNDLISNNLDMQCMRQQDVTEFFNMIYLNEELQNEINKLFQNTSTMIEIWNININKSCIEKEKKVAVHIFLLIYADHIKDNDNLIDIIYLKEEIYKNNNNLELRCDIDTKKEIIVNGDVLRIENYDFKSKYIFINYITYKTVDKSDKKVLNFKPIQLYKRFSYNNKHYIIKGIIIHAGNYTIDSGHYYYLDYNKRSDEWYEFNDSNVSKTKINISNNIYYFDNADKKPVVILYEEEKIQDQDARTINFNLDNHVIFRKEQLNNNQELNDHLLREDYLARLNPHISLGSLNSPDSQPPLLYDESPVSPPPLLYDESPDSPPPPAYPEYPAFQPSLGSGIKPLDELSVSIDKYFSLFQKKA